jgi:hypothetical protein
VLLSTEPLRLRRICSPRGGGGRMARGQKKEMGAGGLRGPLRCGPLGLRAA